MDNAEELKKLKVAELKEKLQALGLPVAGKKDELVARLLEHHDAAHASAGASPKKSSSPSASPKKSAAAVVTSASEDDLADLAPPAEEPKWLAEITAATSKAPRSPAKSPAKSPRAASPAKSPVPHMAPASPKKADAPVPAASALPATATTSEVERARQRAERFGIPVAAVDGPKAAVAAVPSSTPSAKIIPAAAAVDPEVLRKRKERFGEVEVPTPAAKTQKKEQSAVPATQNGAAAASAAAGTPATITATPKPKVLAVGMSEEEREKMRKRAERFGLPVPELAKEAAKIE